MWLSTKKLLVQFSALLFLSPIWMQALALDLKLEWVASISGNVVAYRVYTGNSSRTYSSYVEVRDRTWVRLSGLQTQMYYFAVTALDASGNESEFSNEVSVNGAKTAFILPRFPFVNSQIWPEDESLTGIAVSNRNSETTLLSFTAFNSAGDMIVSPGIENPKTLVLYPGKQLAKLDTEIFGDAISQNSSSGYIRLDSTNASINGFFLMLDAKISLMDGGNFSLTPLHDFVFTEVEANGDTKINLVNSDPDDASVRIDLISADGEVWRSVSSSVKGNGAIDADLHNDLFPGMLADPTSYVRISSTKSIHAFELMQQGIGAIAMHTGQQAAAGRATLYSPQYASDGIYRTSLSIINLDSFGGNVRFRLLSDDGTQTGATRVLPIKANGKLYIQDTGFFLTADPVYGYVEITSDGIRLLGSVLFGDVNRQVFSSALPLVSDLQESAVFSHIASDDLYFTGIAIVNPSQTTATIKLELYAIDGSLIDSMPGVIPAGQRKCRLLTEFFPWLAGRSQTSGYMRLVSDVPVAYFALFGTHQLSVLSAIPAQSVP